MIEIKKLSKKYDDKVLFSDMSVNIDEGDFVILSGESGVGKTTLLNIIGGIEKPDTGDVYFNGLSINNKKNKMKIYRNELGFLFQNFALVEKLTVKENLLVVSPSNRSSFSIPDALEIVGMSGSEGKKVYKLSGGEQQRVAIARLLIKKCNVILADEPTGSLDEKNSDVVMELLKRLNSMGKTIIMVTHNPKYFDYGNRSIVLPYC